MTQQPQSHTTNTTTSCCCPSSTAAACAHAGAWGEAGYFKLKMGVGRGGLCGIATTASYPVKSHPNPAVPLMCDPFGWSECPSGVLHDVVTPSTHGVTPAGRGLVFGPLMFNPAARTTHHPVTFRRQQLQLRMAVLLQSVLHPPRLLPPSPWRGLPRQCPLLPARCARVRHRCRHLCVVRWRQGGAMDAKGSCLLRGGCAARVGAL